MEHVAIDVHQDTQEYPGFLTVGEALKALPQVKHATATQMQYLLENPDQAPDLLKEKRQDRTVNALLFGGTVNKDANDNAYVNAVYFIKHKGLITERYWLVYPMVENLHFALVH